MYGVCIIHNYKRVRETDQIKTLTLDHNYMSEYTVV